MELNEFEKLCLRDPKYDIKLDRFIADFGRENINFCRREPTGFTVSF